MIQALYAHLPLLSGWTDAQRGWLAVGIVAAIGAAGGVRSLILHRQADRELRAYQAEARRLMLVQSREELAGRAMASVIETLCSEERARK